MPDHFVPSRFQQLEHRYLTAQLAGERQLAGLPPFATAIATLGREARLLPTSCRREAPYRELAIGRIRDALAKWAGEAA